MSDDRRAQILAVLRAKKPISERAAMLEQIFDEDGTLTRVEVCGPGRHVLREIEAYGLVIGLDAADLAVTIEFPTGAYAPD